MMLPKIPLIAKPSRLNINPPTTPPIKKPAPAPKPVTPSPRPLQEGDTVKIVGTGNGSSYGNSNAAYGLGWTRQILKVYEGRPYPYRVGNSSGTTGFYKAEALQRQ